GWRYPRDGIASMHERLDSSQALAQFSARMQVGEVFLFEAAFFREGHGERIAEREHGGGRRGGREAERTGFFVYLSIERDLAGGAERGELLLCGEFPGVSVDSVGFGRLGGGTKNLVAGHGDER